MNPLGLNSGAATLNPVGLNSTAAGLSAVPIEGKRECVMSGAFGDVCG